MQPSMPLRGPHYDKDMLNFLPTPVNGDISADSPRKRNAVGSDPRRTMPALTMGCVVSENPEPFPGDDTSGRELQRSVPDSFLRESYSYMSRSVSSSAQFGQKIDSVTPSPSQWGFHESDSGYSGKSPCSRESQPFNYADLQSQLHFPAGKSGTDKSSNMDLLLPEDVKQNVNSGCHENSRQAENSSPMQKGADISSLSGVDVGNLLGIKIGNSILSVDETNNFIKHALQLLGAPSGSGSGSTANHDGSSQYCGGDAMASNATLVSHSQSSSHNPDTSNIVHSLTQTTPLKNTEHGFTLDMPVVNCDKGSKTVADEVKPGYEGSALTEKLWDGTLQLSSSVSVPAVAFFKSGEKMQDFIWSGIAEVKGKVKLNAFEKFVQDLPRSRSRGLMVVSLSWKDDCTADGRKGVTEVAKKYKEAKRVGVAPLSKGTDLYICPHIDAIITILAKHGYFKGTTANTEKSDPLIGCVVWRKDSSSAPTTKASEENVQQSGQSLSVSSGSAARQISDDVLKKVQAETGGGGIRSENKSPQVLVSSQAIQPEQSQFPHNDETAVRQFPHNNETTVREFRTIVDAQPPHPPLPHLGPKQSAEFNADDDDLPEFDFGAAISQTTKNSASLSAAVCFKPEVEIRSPHVQPPISGQMRSETSTVSGTLPDLHYQGPVTLSINHQPEPHQLSIRGQQDNQRGDYTSSLRSSVQALTSQNMGHHPGSIFAVMPIEEQKQADLHVGSSTPRSRFDVDDMPEWCPPTFKKMRQEVNERAGPSFSLSNSAVSGSSFTDLANRRLLPPSSLPPPPPPPPRAPSFTPLNFPNKNQSTEQQRNLPLPPPPPPRPQVPPPPPPLTRPQFPDQNYPSVATASVNSGPPAPRAHVQFQVTHNAPPGHHPTLHPLPPPPPPPPRPVTPPPPRPVTQVNVPNKNYPSGPHLFKPAENSFMHDTPATNKFVLDRPPAPPSQGQFQDVHYPPAPYDRPSPVPDKNTANNSLHRAPADSQMQFRNNNASAWQADQPADDGFGNQNPPLPPGFAPDHAFRPQFHPHRVNNNSYPSAWRSVGP